MPTSSGTTIQGLNGAWTAYRTWAATASHYKAGIDFWNRWGLSLAIAGAILAALGQQIAVLPMSGPILAYAYRVPGAIAAVAVALATYFSSQSLAATRDSTWIRCRAAAESIKSAIYLYRAAVSPFDSPARVTELRRRIEVTLKELNDISPRTPKSEATSTALVPLGVEDYVRVRVIDQITWYRERAGVFQARADRFRKVTLGLGVLSVLLGLATAASVVSSWLSVIATVTTSITAHVKHQHYQSMIGLYLATANRLECLKDEWADNGKTDVDKVDRDAFIQRCEETISTENGAWVAQWNERTRTDDATPRTATKSQGTDGR